MKLCYAAVLALLLVLGCASGPQSASANPWVLLVPPIASNGLVDPGEPLSKWQDAGNFGTQTDCNSLLQRQQFAMQGIYGPMTSASPQNIQAIEALQILKGQCVARDDPRLAK
jgi:hypothetical protein